MSTAWATQRASLGYFMCRKLSIFLFAVIWNLQNIGGINKV